MHTLLQRHRRRSRRRDESGFALIATLIILGCSAMIIMGLLTLTMTTVSFAGDQNLRDDQVQAGDGALEAMLNQLLNDQTNTLGNIKKPCTPDLQSHSVASDDLFNFTINAIPITVSCTPIDDQSQPPDAANVTDVVNVVGSTYNGKLTRAACATSPFVCPEWTGAFGAAGLAGGNDAAVDATNPTLNHVGPGPLWFTASQVRVAKAGAGIRSPYICPAGSTSCTPGGLAGPAMGATGTYVQGAIGLLKDADPNAVNGKSCGVMQADSTVASAQILTKAATRTICGDSVVAALSPSSTGNVVPDAPTDTSGITVGTTAWVQSHRVTTLARTGDPASSPAKGAPFSNYLNADGTVKKTCPAPSGGRVDLLPGAYTRDVMVVLAKWTGGGTSYCQGVRFWFKPGYYWFDMNDATATSFSVDTVATPQYEFPFNDSKSYFIFGTPSVDPVEATNVGTPQLCDPTKAGVSITLSQRTVIRHQRGRVGICGIAGKPAIYQSASAGIGWQATPTTANIGVGKATVNPRNNFAKLFYNTPGATVPVTTPSTISNYDGTRTCDSNFQLGGLATCSSQSLVKLGPGAAWNAPDPGHIPISNALVLVKADAIHATYDSYAPEVSTSVGVYLPGNTTTTPNCGVYYKGVPDNDETLAFDLFDATKSPPDTPPCTSVVHYADELYNATVAISFQTQSDCQVDIFNWFCDPFGLQLKSIGMVAGWMPSGTTLTCVTGSLTGGGSDVTKTCSGKDDSFAGALTRSSSLDVVLGRKQAQMKVTCGRMRTTGEVALWYASFGLAGENYNPRERCGSSVSATYEYDVNDYASPDYASLTNAAAGITAKPLTSAGVMVKGASWCNRNTQGFLGHANTCGPMTKSGLGDGTAQWDQQQVSDATAATTPAWKNWGTPASGSGSGMTVEVLDANRSVICTVNNVALPEHDKTEFLKLPLGSPGCIIPYASSLTKATVRVKLTLARLEDNQYGCSNAREITNTGNQCREWGYNLDWVGLAATSASSTPQNDYAGPAASARITQNKSGDYNSNDAMFNVFGQVVLPRTDLDVVWNGPATGHPMIMGTVPGQPSLVASGQPTLVVKAIGSTTRKPLAANSTPDLVTRRAPAVGVICCADYEQSVRKVTLVAHLTDAARNNPGGLVAWATVEIRVDTSGRRIATIKDWQLCNRTRTDTVCAV